jgi:hypothetical protein
MQRKTKSGPGGPRPGSGRKPLPPGEKRGKRIMLNFTQNEYSALKRMAGKQRLSDFARSIVLRSLARRRN